MRHLQLNTVEVTEQCEFSEAAAQNQVFPAQSQASLRLAIKERAKVFGCLETISLLPIIDAVRILQQKEHYTPCFAGDSPLMPIPEDTAPPPGMDKEKFCGVFECYWRIPVTRIG